jgi:Family of unknown function (DUF6544)
MNASAEDLLERVRRFAMPEGDVEPSDVRFSQQGEMRLAPGAPWRPFRAEQWMSGSSIDFRWRAWFRMAPFAPVLVVDSFESGAGALNVTAFGLLPSPADAGATSIGARPCAVSPSCPGDRSPSAGWRM